MEGNRKLALLESAPVPKAMLALGVPTMLGMLVSALYNLADTWFAGGLGTMPMGAVTTVFPLGQAVTGLGLLFGNGAAAYLSRLLGRGDRDTADKAASTALYGSIVLGAAGDVLPYAYAYARIYIGFSIFNVFNVAMNNIVSSEGAARTAMGALLAGAALNVLLDPVFIYALNLGVAGAAAATAVSQIVSTLIYLWYILRKRSVFRFRVKSCSFSREILSEILKIGVPTLLFQLLTSFSIGMTNNAARVYGGSALAAMGPPAKILSMGSLTVFGFLKGFQAVAGFSCGANNFARLREAVRTALRWSSGACAVFGLTIAAFSGPIAGLFSRDDAELVRIASAALRANGLGFLLFGFSTVYAFLFLSMGRAKEGCFLGACRQGICFIPVILLLPALRGLDGVIWAQPAADVLTAMIAALLALRLHRELRKAEEMQKAVQKPDGKRNF